MSTKRGFLFIANSSKPTAKEANSENHITIGSFGLAAFEAAYHLGFKLYAGINRNHPEKLRCDNFDVTFYDQHIYRDVLAFKDNYRAYKNLCAFLEEHPDIEIIHCNTPIGGVVGRICGWKYNKIVVYSAHGFHFFKGAPLLNWILYYPIERALAKITDAIITINQEDYEIAKDKFNLKKGGMVFYIPGVGVETRNECFEKRSIRNKKRIELGLSDNIVLCIVVGDLNDNKIVETLIKALPLTNTDVHYAICGVGPNDTYLKALASKLDVSTRCHFLGFRNDVKELYYASDIFLLASKREGLPRSTMEAMAAGLPCIVSEIRGNVDLIKNEIGGYVCKANDAKCFAEKINFLAINDKLRVTMGEQNLSNVKKYDIENIKAIMLNVFERIMGIK